MVLNNKLRKGTENSVISGHTARIKKTTNEILALNKWHKKKEITRGQVVKTMDGPSTTWDLEIQEVTDHYERI